MGKGEQRRILAIIISESSKEALLELVEEWAGDRKKDYKDDPEDLDFVVTTMREIMADETTSEYFENGLTRSFRRNPFKTTLVGMLPMQFIREVTKERIREMMREKVRSDMDKMITEE